MHSYHCSLLRFDELEARAHAHHEAMVNGSGNGTEMSSYRLRRQYIQSVTDKLRSRVQGIVRIWEFTDSIGIHAEPESQERILAVVQELGVGALEDLGPARWDDKREEMPPTTDEVAGGES